MSQTASAVETTPAFIAADVPGIFLPSTFKLQAADKNLVPDASIFRREAPDPQVALNGKQDTVNAFSSLQGSFTGPGFNQIFRPHSKATPITDLPKDRNNVLELNLTHETWSFGTKDLGLIPNRGLGTQKDLDLTGVVYMQTVLDVTDPKGERLSTDRAGKLIDANNSPIERTLTGRKPREIHFETGMLLNVPPTQVNPNRSLARMASIPHGVTINLQGDDAFLSPDGKPHFDPVDITPFDINKFSGFNPPKASQDVTNKAEARLPQDLTAFKNTITAKLLKDPNSLLVDHNVNKTIIKTIVFQLSNFLSDKQRNPLQDAIDALNKAAESLVAVETLAGTNKAIKKPTIPSIELNRISGLLSRTSNVSNIAFLDGSSPGGPNASVAQVSATFWISTVNYTFQIPEWKPPTTANEKLVPLRITPEVASAGKPYVKGTVPTFAFPTTKAFKAQSVTVPAVQIQYTQTVTLNFGGESWPHVSVATVVPLEDVQVSADKIKF